MVLFSLSPVQFAQAEVAVCNERKHPKFFSKGESLAIVIFSLPDIRWVFARSDLAEEQKRVPLARP